MSLCRINFHKNFHEKQSMLFPESDDSNEIVIKNDNDWDLYEKLEKEIDAFGFYLSDHPTKIYKKILNNSEILDLDILILGKYPQPIGFCIWG